jgi:hypothetical protein
MSASSIRLTLFSKVSVIPGLPDRLSDCIEIAFLDALPNLERASSPSLVLERSKRIKLGFFFINVQISFTTCLFAGVSDSLSP